MDQRYEAVVIGTGFGGAISACRLSKQWPGRVLVLERGKRYPMGSFPRTPHEMARNFWNVPDEKRSRPRGMVGDESHGMFDIRAFRHIDAVVCAGLGGGSLIYANVFLEPPEHVFDERWPQSCKKNQLTHYYSVAKEVLGARPIPRNNDPRRRIVRTEVFEQFAREVGRKSELVDINVFFGNDFNNPLEIGRQDVNRYGAVQTSCVYCAECDVGCNTHSKNTLDLNYLFVAERRYQADIRTEHLADRVVPVNERDEDDPSQDGQHGFRVYFRDLNARHLNKRSEPQSALTNRVVVSAGTLGSNELLLRCRDVFKTLPRVSSALGRSYSGNGDFLSFVVGADRPINPNYGPVITQRTDFNLYENWDSQRAFVLEDASYPAFGAWFTEGVKPGFLGLGAVWRMLRHTVGRFITRSSNGSLGYAVGDLLSGDVSQNTGVLLCMGIDRSDGVLSLDANGHVEADWRYRNSMPLYDAILQAGRKFKEVFRAKSFVPLPSWLWPLRRNVTVHSLGGCVLADSPDKGVTNSDRTKFGQVFGYRNLYVADGAIVPTAVGANPIATISALSEMVAEGITGQRPDANL